MAKRLIVWGLLVATSITGLTLGWLNYREYTAMLVEAEAAPITSRNDRLQYISFIAVGDTGDDNMGQWLVARAMSHKTAGQPLDFVLLLGDNFYDEGIRSVEDHRWKTTFEHIYGLPGLAVPFYAVLGNHDHKGNAEAQIEYTRHSHKWRLPARYYSWTEPLGDGDQVLFVALDTTPMRHIEAEAEQFTWLENTLAKSRAKWKIVFGHHPIIRTDGDVLETHELQQALEPLFIRYGVDMYIAGHDHELAYLNDLSGMVQVVSGAGSRPRDPGACEGTVFASGAFGFAHVLVTADKLKVEFWDDDNNALFARTIEKSGAAVPRNQGPLADNPDAALARLH